MKTACTVADPVLWNVAKPAEEVKSRTNGLNEVHTAVLVTSDVDRSE